MKLQISTVPIIIMHQEVGVHPRHQRLDVSKALIDLLENYYGSKLYS